MRARLGRREAWPGGVLRITTTDTLMHKVLPPLLAAFHSRVQDVQLQVTTSNAMVKIGEHEADVAIRAGGRPPDPLVGRKLCGLESTIDLPLSQAAGRHRRQAAVTAVGRRR